jgi:hypothetical protein
VSERKLTDEEKDQLKDKVLGTCDSIDSAIEFLEIDTDAETAEDGLLDRNVERCRGCGWWLESGELDGEREGEIGYCQQCASPDDDD